MAVAPRYLISYPPLPYFVPPLASEYIASTLLCLCVLYSPQVSIIVQYSPTHCYSRPQPLLSSVSSAFSSYLDLPNTYISYPLAVAGDYFLFLFLPFRILHLSNSTLSRLDLVSLRLTYLPTLFFSILPYLTLLPAWNFFFLRRNSCAFASLSNFVFRTLSPPT